MHIVTHAQWPTGAHSGTQWQAVAHRGTQRHIVVQSGGMSHITAVILDSPLNVNAPRLDLHLSSQHQCHIPASLPQCNIPASCMHSDSRLYKVFPEACIVSVAASVVGRCLARILALGTEGELGLQCRRCLPGTDNDTTDRYSSFGRRTNLKRRPETVDPIAMTG